MHYFRFAVLPFLILVVLLSSGCSLFEDDDDDDDTPVRPQFVQPIGQKMVALGSSLTFQIEGSDADSAKESLIYSVSPLPLPPNISFSSKDGIFKFRPAINQVKEFEFTFMVSDGQLSSSEIVPVIVTGATGITGLSGRLMDANDAQQDIETPIANVTVSLLDTDKSESDSSDINLSVTTDNEGYFSLQNIEGEVQILDLAPATGDYAGFRESIILIEGVNNVIERPFYLPRIEKPSLTKVEPDTITTVNNARLGMTLTVPPNTAKNVDGSDFTGSLSISEVPRSLAPAPLPAEFEPGLLVTIQPVGVQFSTPVPMTFPNIDKLAAGEEVDIWSIDPDRGVFTVVGIGQVSADETTIEMISGGIIAADWHFPAPASPDGKSDSENNNPDNDDANKKCKSNVGSSASIQGGCLTISHTLPAYRSLEASRALRFIYNSESANPAPIINTESTLPPRTALPKAFSASVTDIGGMAVNNIQYIKATDAPLKHAVQFDGKNYPTGQYAYSFELSSHYEASVIKSITKDFVLINNEINSPFGAGWTLDGLQRIYPQQGRDRVTLTEGDGSIKAFTPQGAVSEGTKTDLAFVIDGSGSIENEDFRDQLKGFAIAIKDPLTVPLGR